MHVFIHLMSVTTDGEILRFECPNCKIGIEVHRRQANCRIFRCGIMKSTGEPVNPHLSHEMCLRLKERDLIYGCGHPFQLTSDLERVETCDYI